MIPRPERSILLHPPWQYGKSEQNTALNLYGPRTGPVDILLIASNTPVLFQIITGEYESEIS
jgi:hypothetical protein